MTGKTLFRGKELREVIILNRECKINFDSIDNNPSISNDARDLLKKLLMKDPKQRLSAAEALSHPFILDAQQAEVKEKLETLKLDSEDDLVKNQEILL